MAYATVQQFIDYVGVEESADLSADIPGDSANQTRIAEALRVESDTINAHIARYLPLLDPAPAWIEQCTIDLARERLSRNIVTEEVRDKAMTCRRMLMAVAKGDADFGLRVETAQQGQPLTYILGNPLDSVTEGW